MATCRDCDNIQLRNCRPSNTKSGVTCYCTEYCRYEDPDSKACGKYFVPRNPKNRYHITTKIVEKLGLGKESFVYQTIEDLREKALENNPYYEGIVEMYDIIGPVVAEELYEDKEFGFQNCIIALNEFIIPTCMEYSSGNVPGAIDIYTTMVEELMQVYGITLESAIIRRNEMEESNAFDSYYSNGNCLDKYPFNKELEFSRKRVLKKEKN